EQKAARQNGQDLGRDTPPSSSRYKARWDDWNSIRVTLEGQQSSNRPHQKAEYMTAPDLRRIC
ncbi:hypothetical protein NKJ73_28815, partial [Mesorhizobium sp. M0074]|uniref:hypothetical protein n=1 Tax=Mesorhizobium sp. M0074 TaxID=2956869 RepID=UPI00333C2ABA